MQSPLSILKKYWGYDGFRPLQEEIIESVLAGIDTLALLPTGGGKSICFQVPALSLEGICIVVSPLIALMKDQVYQLNKRGVRAQALHAGMNRREIDIILDNCIYGDTKFLYLSPERLKSEMVIERAKQMNVSVLAIDEAHCISQWGYDFRPPYLEIAHFKEFVPNAVIIALTATATTQVSEDIINRLELWQPKVFTKSFSRANLSYAVFNKEKKEPKLLEIISNVPGSSVVYVRNRKRTQIIAEYLRQQGISADYYHAGLNNDQRSRKQDAWINGETRVIVATNAFGMGIDKPDVRTVVHLDIPDSLENYYQEAGRAGRDGKRAFAVLLYNQEDLISLEEGLQNSFPSTKLLKSIYQSLANYFKVAVGSNYLESYDFDLESFAKNVDLKPFEVYQVVVKLADLGFIQLNESFYQLPKIQVLVDKTDLYRIEIEHPSLEAIIKAVLRLYGGSIFSEYVEIKLPDIAKLIGVEVSVVEKKLQTLHQFNVISYFGHKNSPQVTFLTPRYDASKLPIDEKEVKKRKEVKEAQIKAIKSYVLSVSHCRTRRFQEYFGEPAYEDCGNCDFCIRKKKTQTSSKQSTMREAILEALKDKSISIDRLHTQLGVNEDVLITEVRILLEQEILTYDEWGNLRVP